MKKIVMMLILFFGSSGNLCADSLQCLDRNLDEIWQAAPEVDSIYPYTNSVTDSRGFTTTTYGPDAIAYLKNQNQFLIINKGRFWYLRQGVWKVCGNLADYWDKGIPDIQGHKIYENIIGAFYRDNQLTIVTQTTYRTLYWTFDFTKYNNPNTETNELITDWGFLEDLIGKPPVSYTGEYLYEGAGLDSITYIEQYDAFVITKDESLYIKDSQGWSIKPLGRVWDAFDTISSCNPLLINAMYNINNKIITTGRDKKVHTIQFDNLDNFKNISDGDYTAYDIEYLNGMESDDYIDILREDDFDILSTTDPGSVNYILWQHVSGSAGFRRGYYTDAKCDYIYSNALLAIKSALIQVDYETATIIDKWNNENPTKKYLYGNDGKIFLTDLNRRRIGEDCPGHWGEHAGEGMDATYYSRSDTNCSSGDCREEVGQTFKHLEDLYTDGKPDIDKIDWLRNLLFWRRVAAIYKPTSIDGVDPLIAVNTKLLQTILDRARTIMRNPASRICPQYCHNEMDLLPLLVELGFSIEMLDWLDNVLQAINAHEDHSHLYLTDNIVSDSRASWNTLTGEGKPETVVSPAWPEWYFIAQ